MRRLLAIAAALYAVALLADGAVTLADSGLRLWLHAGGLGLPRAALSFMVGSGALLLYLVGGASRAISLRTHGAAILFPLASNAVMTPLVMSLTTPLSMAELVIQRPEVVAVKAPALLYVIMAAALVQVAVAALTIRKIRGENGGRLLPAEEPAPAVAPSGGVAVVTAVRPPARAFTWRWGLGFAAMNAALLLVLGPAFLAITAIVTVNALGRGYVSCNTAEITLTQKDLVRDGKTVSLVGMMHVGEESFYKGLLDSIEPVGSVLLAEGVSDRKNLMHHDMQYKEVASATGLTPQAAVFAPRERGLEVLNADVDIESFSPSTIEALNGIAAMHAQKGDVGSLVKLQLRMSDPEVLETLFRDIVDRRNEHLLFAIDAALPTHDRVVVPWGALHLRDIETALLAKGFKIVTTTQRTVVRFATVREKLAAR